MKRALALAAPTLLCALVPACGGQRSRSPVCGMAQLVAPTMIQQALTNATAIISDPPRGLPDSLPARVAGTSEQGDVKVGYDPSTRKLVLGFENAAFINRPECRGDTTGRCGYGLLVVDDTSQRIQGVLVYQGAAPTNYPKLGVVSGNDLVLPLFGVRVDWLGLNNPKCPLLGSPAPGAK